LLFIQRFKGSAAENSESASAEKAGAAVQVADAGDMCWLQGPTYELPVHFCSVTSSYM